jgi:hypothetical protein
MCLLHEAAPRLIVRPVSGYEICSNLRPESDNDVLTIAPLKWSFYSAAHEKAGLGRQFYSPGFLCGDHYTKTISNEKAHQFLRRFRCHRAVRLYVHDRALDCVRK